MELKIYGDFFLPRRILETLVTPLLFSKEPGLASRAPIPPEQTRIYTFICSKQLKAKDSITIYNCNEPGAFRTTPPPTPLVPH